MVTQKRIKLKPGQFVRGTDEDEEYCLSGADDADSFGIVIAAPSTIRPEAEGRPEDPEPKIDVYWFHAKVVDWEWQCLLEVVA